MIANGGRLADVLGRSYGAAPGELARKPWAARRKASLTALAGLACHVAWGGPGDIDPSFADGGVFRWELLADVEQLFGFANSILTPGDGTYIVSGGFTQPAFPDGPDPAFPDEEKGTFGLGWLTRLTNTGALDGVEPQGFGGETLTTVLQPDQKIVAIVRETRPRNMGWRDTAYRLHPDGAFDTAFGSGGLVELAFVGLYNPRVVGSWPPMSPALALGPGGEITIAGRQNGNLVVSRLRADGSSDEGFAVHGTYTGYGLGLAENSMVITHGGGYRVLTRKQLETGARCRVLALTHSGARDAEFGTSGYADLGTPADAPASCSNLVQLADGRLLVVGTKRDRAFAIRLLPDGAVDPTFSSADIAETARSLEKAAVDGRGRIVVVGRGPADVAGVVVARLQNDGTVDPSFGNGGSTWVDVGGYALARDLALLADNAILIAGAAVRDDLLTRANWPFVARLFGDGGGDGSSILGVMRPRNGPVEEGSQAVVAIRRTGGRSGAVSVLYHTTAATESEYSRAIEGHDYTPVSGELRWGDGDFTDREIVVPISADAGVGEEPETLLIQLADPTGGATLGTGSATLEIAADGAPAGLFTIETREDWGVNTGECGSVPIGVARKYYSSGAVSVTLTPESLSAVAGQDFAAESVTVSWADGEGGVKEIQIPITCDREYEQHIEAFTVQLTKATAGAIGARSTALIRIFDWDQPPPPTTNQPPPPTVNQPPQPPANPATSGGGGQTGWLSTMLLLCLCIARRRGVGWLA